jgi:hypothetical protein
MGFLSLCTDSSHPPGLNNPQHDPDGSHITSGYPSSAQQQGNMTPTSNRVSLHSVTAYYTSDDAYPPPPLNLTPSPLSSLHVISVLTSPSPYQFTNHHQALLSRNATFLTHGMDYTAWHQPPGCPLIMLQPLVLPQQQDSTSSPLSSLHAISTLTSPSPYQFTNHHHALLYLNATFQTHDMDYMPAWHHPPNDSKQPPQPHQQQ